MIANQAAQDAIAQNLANASTTGYKQDIPQFQSFGDVLLGRINSQNGGSVGPLGNGANLKGLVTDFADGALQKTGNALDVALTGDAFLTVQTPHGVRLTRDGALTLNPQGQLVQANGNGLILGGNGQPIRIPARAKAITISERGQISADGKAVGRLGLAGVSRADQPVKVGDNLFAVRALRPASATASVRQGYLEGSNVSVVKEMVSMIGIMRAYETNQKMLQSEDDATGKAVNDVAKV